MDVTAHKAARKSISQNRREDKEARAQAIDHRPSGRNRPPGRSRQRITRKHQQSATPGYST
ncbi:unnamed protein product [Amoebophrya sp. A25]|nr:unnamed protein product [Amoebophrya sp. A25]|eukprot:GSA25T00013004001.1